MTTPQEKAKELVQKYEKLLEEGITATDGGGWDNCSIHGISHVAKKCALIAAETHIYSENDSPFNTMDEWLEDNLYWQQVLTEIDKL